MTGSGPRLAGLALLMCFSTGCGHPSQPECVVHPCPVPTAIWVSVTSSMGGPVPGLTVTVSGPLSGSGQCDVGTSATSCIVWGDRPGTYSLQLTAAGFQAKTLSVVVPGSTPACGCPIVDTQQESAVLDPT
jgi:hypothetical protein